MIIHPLISFRSHHSCLLIQHILLTVYSTSLSTPQAPPPHSKVQYLSSIFPVRVSLSLIHTVHSFNQSFNIANPTHHLQVSTSSSAPLHSTIDHFFLHIHWLHSDPMNHHLNRLGRVYLLYIFELGSIGSVGYMYIQLVLGSLDFCFCFCPVLFLFLRLQISKKKSKVNFHWLIFFSFSKNSYAQQKICDLQCGVSFE